MSEMVERVARAIYRQRLIDLELYEDRQAEATTAVDRGFPLCRTEARAAIAAMREPTEAMVEAATGEQSEDNSQAALRDIYRAMIDAALDDHA